MRQKLTNFQKKKKKDFLCQKNKLGLSLKKKGIFWPKIDQLKKKRNWGGKKQAEAERKKKKKIWGQKIGEKFDNKVEKLPNSKTK